MPSEWLLTLIEHSLFIGGRVYRLQWSKRRQTQKLNWSIIYCFNRVRLKRLKIIWNKEKLPRSVDVAIVLYVEGLGDKIQDQFIWFQLRLENRYWLSIKQSSVCCLLQLFYAIFRGSNHQTNSWERNYKRDKDFHIEHKSTIWRLILPSGTGSLELAPLHNGPAVN